ncbi:hypothetical protein ACTXT7_017374 [Hymenolepis weldensis]
MAYLCVTPGPRIFEQDIVLNQQAMRCFRFVTDFNQYPSWLDSVKAVTSDVDPSSAMVGTEFELLFSKNYVETPDTIDVSVFLESFLVETFDPVMAY